MQEVARVPIHPRYFVLAFSPDGDRVAIDSGQTLTLIELKSGRVLREIDPGRPAVGAIAAVVSAAITAEGTIISSHEDQVIRVWDSTGEKKLLDLAPRVQGEPFRDLENFGRGGWVIGRGRTEIRLWDLKSGKLLNHYAQPDPLVSLDLHPKEGVLVTANEKNVVNVWDVTAGNPEATFRLDPAVKVTRLLFTPGGNLLYVPSGRPEFSLLNRGNGAVLQIFPGPDARVIDAAARQ